MKRKTDNFNKFYNKKRNSAIKEEFRQEKKAAKKERKEAIERRFEEKRQARGFQAADGRGVPGGRDERAPFNQGGRPGKFRPAGAGAVGGRDENQGDRRPGKPTITPAKAGQSVKPAKAAQPVQSGGQTGQSSAAASGETLPLNKYIAHGGICSRRDAADLIRVGKVSVNGQTITEPGTKVLPTDTVKVNGKKITISRNFVYILLNKPKDYITTTEDPQGRRTVLDLIRQATTERVYPIGRLDRNTSGVLLLTNDGDLSQKLAHPSHEIKKIYHVMLDKALTKADFDKIIGGQVHLEDGVANVDVLAYADPKDKTQIGIEIHSGRNRIVRRIFEHLGYDVRGLDRVTYAGLTKKNVQRGHWRLLTEKEVRILKYLNSSIKGSPAKTKEWAAANADSVASKNSRPAVPSGKPAAKFAKSGKPNAAKDFESGEKPERFDARPERADSRPPRTDGRPPRSDARPPRTDSRPERADGRPPRSGSKPSKAGGKRSSRPDGRAARTDARAARPASPEKSYRPSARPPRADGKPPRADARPARTDGKPKRASASANPGKRPARSIPPKGRKPTSAKQPNSRRPHKSTNFNNDQGE